jgi:diguanylate cyclase (GGDEF)-like protein
MPGNGPIGSKLPIASSYAFKPLLLAVDDPRIGPHPKPAVAPPSPGADDETRSFVLRSSGVLDSSPDPELDRWTAFLRRNTGAGVAALCFLDASRRVVRSVCTVAGAAGKVSELALAESLESYVLGQAGPPNSTGPGSLYAESPISVDGQLLGHVCIADNARSEWAEVDLEALVDTATAVSTALALRLAKNEAERVQQLVASHNTVHDLIARGAPLRDVLTEILESVERYDPSVKASLLMLDSTSRTLHSGLGPSLPPGWLAAIDGVVIGPNVGTCGAAAWSGQLTVTGNIAEDPSWAPIRDKAKAAGLGHCWSMPITSVGGEVLGTLALYGPRPRLPLPEQLAWLGDWARLAGIAIERRQALGRLTHDARHDSLTGLPNRMAIFEALDDAIERVDAEGMAAVLFIDLDGLKDLNDTLGHDHADEMIREMGARLSAAMRPDDFVGRFGGDEFLAIAEGIGDKEQAASLGLRLLHEISQPLPGVDATVLTASIGIALVRSDAVDAREVIRASDSAMYDAKRSGRDRVTFFEGGERVHAGRRLALVRELRGAETRGEMRLVFHPVLALPGLEIVGVEALLRWTNPIFGEVSPVEFVPIAEETGAIVPIGTWVLRESCEMMARASEPGRPLELNVNVSARQVSNPDFALWVRQTLAHAEFPADKLGLEITETSLMRPNAVTAGNLRELDALGVRIVLDDFGTGYSSLSWLKQHPFSAIKIDGSFIAGVAGTGADHAIVAAVIGMAKAIGCTVTAEGVETEHQLTVLRELDCPRAQGFLFSLPVPAEELGALLRVWRRAPYGQAEAA